MYAIRRRDAEKRPVPGLRSSPTGPYGHVRTGQGGKISITDGPFAETKEQLAGFYLVEAPNLDKAIEIASKIPPAQVGTIEVRPVRELMNTKGQQRPPRKNL